MKANRLAALAGLVALAACAPKPAPRPVPAPAPPVVIRPAPQPTPPPPRDWRDAPQSPGEWSWTLVGGRSTARYGLVGQAPEFSLVCDRARASVVLTRAGAAPAPMALYTTSGNRSFNATGVVDGAEAALSARDPILDAIAFSRGRFAVELPGTASLYLPSWPELSRVIEDCR
ncbi:MAG: hypothetical protein ACREBO_06600 [Novosphingobium sp.]